MNEANIIQFPTTKNDSTSSLEATLAEVKKGKLKKRFYAFFTDLFFIGIIQKALVFTYVAFINNSFYRSSIDIKSLLVNNLWQMRLSTLVFTFFSYFLVSLYMGHGKTLGKTFFNLRVVSHEGEPQDLSFMEAFMRTMGYTTCYVAYSVLFCLPLFRKDQKGLPDLFSQTEVLTEEEFNLLYAQSASELGKETEQLDLFSA